MLADIQYSAALIAQMKEKHASRPEMTWLEMDVLDLQFGEEEFDLVVDKGQSTRTWRLQVDGRHYGVCYSPNHGQVS